MAPIGRAAQADFDVARAFRPQVRIGKAGVVQVVECGRAKCGPVTGGDAQILREAPAPQHATGGVAPELALVVAALIELQRLRAEAALPLREQATIGTRVLREGVVA